MENRKTYYRKKMVTNASNLYPWGRRLAPWSYYMGMDPWYHHLLIWCLPSMWRSKGDLSQGQGEIKDGCGTHKKDKSVRCHDC